MSEPKRSRIELILDLLAEEMEDRLRTGRVAQPQSPAAMPQPPAQVAAARPRVAARPAEPKAAPPPAAAAQPEPELEPEPPPMTGPAHAARLIVRLALGLLVGIVLVNVPLNRFGTTLATAMPQSEALAIRNGLVVKEEDASEIYVYQNGAFRWISSLEAFDHFGYTWNDVHIVEDGWLAPFEMGTPIHVLLKCTDSPHIYQLENGTKRWIVDIDTFTAEGHVWEDVDFVSCRYLRDLPDGETIPPGKGPAPQP